MHTERPVNTPRKGRAGSFFLLLAVGAACAYAGMRWHAELEHLLIPSRPVSPAASSDAPSESSTQLWTCGMHPQVIQNHPGDCPICHMKLTPLAAPNQAKTIDTPGVTIDPVVVQNMGVRTVDVTEAPVTQELRAYALITEAESAHHDINLRVSGWIQTLYANTDGMEVRKGQPLFDLYSPELKLAIEELVAARRSTSPAPSNADANPDPHASLASAAEGRLVALGLTPEQVAELAKKDHAPEFVTFVSPIDGHVTAKEGIYSGSAVTAGQRIMQIAQRTTMWIDARIPERDLPSVRVGQPTRAIADAYPGRVFEGQVIFIHPHFDEATRTALVRMELTNHDYALHEGMYATVSIQTGDAQPVVQVPREAIIDSGQSQLVFVSLGSGRFEPRRVVVGRPGPNGHVQIAQGLKPGERIVASGQFLLDSESRLREAIAKFLGNATAQPASPADPGASAADHPAPPPAQTFPAPAEQVDAVVAAYLPLAESLGMVQTSNVPLKVDALVTAIHALHAEVRDPAGITLITTAAEAVEAMKDQSLDKQRELFKVASSAIIALVDAMPPSPAIANSLFIVNCPMAKADWLQRTREIANPYYAEEMKECGSVVRPVRSTKGAR